MRSKLPLDEDDVALIFEDLHRGRSIIPPHDVPSRPTLVRWELTRPLTVDNCVVMDYADVEKHLRSSVTEKGRSVHPREIWGEETQKVVDRRAAEIAKEREWVM